LLGTAKNVTCYSDQLALLALTGWTSERSLETFYENVIRSPLPKYIFCLEKKQKENENCARLLPTMCKIICINSKRVLQKNIPIC